MFVSKAQLGSGVGIVGWENDHGNSYIVYFQNQVDLNVETHVFSNVQNSDLMSELTKHLTHVW